MLALDRGVFHRQAHVVSLKESHVWTVVWVMLAMVFNAGVWHYAGSQEALEFFTGLSHRRIVERGQRIRVRTDLLLFCRAADKTARGVVLGNFRRAHHAGHQDRGGRVIIAGRSAALRSSSRKTASGGSSFRSARYPAATHSGSGAASSFTSRTPLGT
jgi:hypothetical protein